MNLSRRRSLPVYLEPEQVSLLIAALEALLDDEANCAVVDYYASLNMDQLQELEKLHAKLSFLKRVSQLPAKGGRK